jgi:hypothetical protein
MLDLCPPNLLMGSTPYWSGVLTQTKMILLQEPRHVSSLVTKLANGQARAPCTVHRAPWNIVIVHPLPS